MLHVAAIRSALERNDLDAIEGAFRLLVAFPHAGLIEGADTTDVLAKTLDDVADHLARDPAVMPDRTREAIMRAGPKTMAEGASYAEGARVVTAHRRHWHAIFLMHSNDEPRAAPRRAVEPPAWVSFELPRSLAKGLDAFIAAQPDAGLSRSEATRVLLRHALAKLGYVEGADGRSHSAPDGPHD